jgi:catechol 2,3-dioxygenase-like lactoylglutathione lyase family enzyme
MSEKLIERVFHVNIVVRDFERSLKWYTEVLGAKVADGPFNAAGKELFGIGEGAQMWGVEPNEVEIKFAFLTFGDDDSEVVLDILQFVKPQSWGAPPPTLQHIGIARIALKVPDAEKAYQVLKERGVVFQTELCPLSIGDDYLSNIAYACFYGPDGEVLEIYGPQRAA